MVSLARHAITDSELEVLRDPRRESGYKHVYRHKRGWQARSFRQKVIGTFPEPVPAAASVCHWWRANFGPRWPEVFQRRLTTGWVCTYNPRLKAVIVTAWPMGVARTIDLIHRPPASNPQEWKDFVRWVRINVVHPWARREFGLFAPVSLWKGVPLESRPRPRAYVSGCNRRRDEEGRFAAWSSPTPTLAGLLVDSPGGCQGGDTTEGRR